MLIIVSLLSFCYVKLHCLCYLVYMYCVFVELFLRYKLTIEEFIRKCEKRGDRGSPKRMRPKYQYIKYLHPSACLPPCSELDAAPMRHVNFIEV